MAKTSEEQNMVAAALTGGGGGGGSKSTSTGSEQQEVSPALDVSDLRYRFDLEKLEALRRRAPWTDDPKYLKKVAVSPSAVTKMMAHCHVGVTKGMRKGGRPVEVMGLLLGRPDPRTPHTLILTDAFPLSVEGFETSVVTDNDEVFNEMIKTAESVDRTRHERVMGWYHSHPFDVGPHSHCFLSGTDHQTQLHWQRSEDPTGNPWLAVVIDPLRSLHQKNPELKAFRAYPPDHAAPRKHECPDGQVLHEEQHRLERWGKCWDRYYELEVEYYMSASARRVMAILTQTYLWTTTLGTTPTLDTDTKRAHADRLRTCADRLKIATTQVKTTTHHTAGSKGPGGALTTSSSSSGTRATTASTTTTAAAGAPGEQENNEGGREQEYQPLVELAVEKLHGNIAQAAKQHLFC